MELGHVAGHTGTRRHLVTVDRASLGDHVAVQVPADRLGQRGDASDMGVEVGVGKLRGGCGLSGCHQVSF